MQVPKLSKETQASLKAVQTSEEDRQVRQEAELERLGGVARQVRSTNFSNGGKPIEQMYFVVPVRGEISSEFAADKSHFGIDLVAPKNTAVRATMDGYVFLSDWTLETGNTIGIQHANNIISFYKHNAQLLKKAGNFVRAGEAIAIIGNTGEKTDGPHLHFELWHKGTPVNPADYIAF
jgi:murein DD-endopeptidase MepM/ murein hydrolase activator NlpD